MTATPRIGAPELVSGQAIPETTVNQQAVLFDAFVCPHFKDRTLAAPPGSPAQGDIYLVAASPTGAWTGKAGYIAIYINTSWTFVLPLEGFMFWVDNEDILIAYDGTNWFPMTGAAAASVAYAATVTLDFKTALCFDIGTLTGNITLANPSNMKAGQSGRIRLTQDGTGSRTITYGSYWKFAGGSPALSTAPGTIDVIAYYVHSTTDIEATLSKAFS